MENRAVRYSPQGASPYKIIQRKKFEQLGHFKQLQIGAGSSVFNSVNGFVWGGAKKYSDGKFKLELATGALSINGSITATSGSITGNLSVTGSLEIGDTSGAAIKLSGTTGDIGFLYDDVSKGSIAGYTSSAHSENGYIRIYAQSGRSLVLRESQIECNGNFNPSADEGSSLGSSSQSWNDIYAKSIIANGTNAKFSINGNDGENASESGVTDFDITIVGGIITNFSKN